MNQRQRQTLRGTYLQVNLPQEEGSLTGTWKQDKSRPDYSVALLTLPWPQWRKCLLYNYWTGLRKGHSVSLLRILKCFMSLLCPSLLHLVVCVPLRCVLCVTVCSDKFAILSEAQSPARHVQLSSSRCWTAAEFPLARLPYLTRCSARWLRDALWRQPGNRE